MGSHRRVVVVEDDAQLGAQIVQHLEGAGLDLQVRWLRTGQRLDEDALRDVVLVVLDLMLPGLHGLDVLKHLRTVSDVPVLILSARNDTHDRVRGLQLGADDYLSKPFWPEELVERVRARLRRPALVRGGEQKLGPLALDLERRAARLRGQELALTRVELELLAALAERPGAAVTRRALVTRVLDPDRDGDERTLDVHVSRLRRKLGDDAALIATVWGIGYRLVLPEAP